MAVNVFLKIPGVDGEAPTSGHEGEIECLALRYGVSRPHSATYGGGSGSTQAEPQELVISKWVDKASPKLFQKCCDGTHFADGVQFVFSETGGESPVDYLTVKLKEVTITNVGTSANQGGDKAAEDVSFSYVEIAIDYQPQDTKGAKQAKVSAGWSFKARKAQGG